MATITIKRTAVACALVSVLAVASCANQDPDGRAGSVGVGTVGGAGAGALAGRWIAGSNNNALAIGAGALLGGVAGNLLVDRPEDKAQAADAEAARDRDAQRQLELQRQSQIQEAQVEQELQEQRLYEQWKAQQAGAASVTPVSSSADVEQAQRLLIAQGYLTGPADGVAGPGTAAAVRSYQAANGLPITGQITPSLISSLRTTL